MPTAHAETIINAPIETVWSHMTDFGGYGEWNSFIRKVEVDHIAVGGTVRLFVHFYNGKTVESVEGITRLDSPKTEADGVRRAHLEYEFLGPLPTLYLVRGRRLQSIEAIDACTTRYITHERLYGLLALFAPIVAVQKGFETHGANLKAICEQGKT